MPERQCENWLSTYIQYTLNSEAPEVFHLWTGISVIASVLQRDVWIARGHYSLFPSLFICFVADTGGRKSSAIRIGRKLARQSEKVIVMPERITPEQMLVRLASATQKRKNGVITHHASTSFFSSELKVLLQREGLVPLLTDLFDCEDPWINETKGSGVDKLNGVCINAVLGTTPEWLSDSMPASAIGGGFTGRIIYIYVEKRDRSIPMPIPPDSLLGGKLLHDLEEIGMIAGEYRLNKEATDWFVDWYEHYEIPMHPHTKGFNERLHDHMLRVSIPLAASRTNERIITLGDLQGSLMLLQNVEATMRNVFKDVRTSSTNVEMNILMRVLREKRRLNVRVLRRYTYNLIDDITFQRVLNDLVLMECIGQEGQEIIYIQDPHV